MTTSAAPVDPRSLDPGTPRGQIVEALYEVIDPDLGINIVDLGFVLDVALDDDRHAILTMTLTSAACPLTGIMEDQIRTTLVGGLGLATGFHIDWIWTPAWTPARITDEGREQLRAIGFTM
ncbi:metal-sulfur cluster assembly factor [Amycolatopsis rubida]|uniref:Metal-sulfur cluster biosynthetic enzyme n=1 Tax=Amycolatopsis rubida TaxID=112413 RepID=A0A1I5NCC5_9PSEU|nr:metal-sulfur cluster assembly factor [Amycolatopsis rubida]SFP19468.1 Metal-sulfur cluster biosynthetic enzyme [Amycolatopsis rubida]